METLSRLEVSRVHRLGCGLLLTRLARLHAMDEMGRWTDAGGDWIRHAETDARQHKWLYLSFDEASVELPYVWDNKDQFYRDMRRMRDLRLVVAKRAIQGFSGKSKNHYRLNFQTLRRLLSELGVEIMPAWLTEAESASVVTPSVRQSPLVSVVHRADTVEVERPAPAPVDRHEDCERRAKLVEQAKHSEEVSAFIEATLELYPRSQPKNLNGLRLLLAREYCLRGSLDLAWTRAIRDKVAQSGGNPRSVPHFFREARKLVESRYDLSERPPLADEWTGKRKWSWGSESVANRITQASSVDWEACKCG